MTTPDSPISLHTPEPTPFRPNPRVNTHYAPPPSPHGYKRFARRYRNATSTLSPYTGWEASGDRRPQYHAYVHSLVEAGWDNLITLDEYMKQDVEDAKLVVRVLDLLPPGASDETNGEADGEAGGEGGGCRWKRWEDIHDGDALAAFIERQKKVRGGLRLYCAEQEGDLAAGVMEVLGSGLGLDPRFFQWGIRKTEKSKKGKGKDEEKQQDSVQGFWQGFAGDGEAVQIAQLQVQHVMSPSERHRAPFFSLGFTIPKGESGEAETFRVAVYVKRDEEGEGWTGILISTSHTTLPIAPQIFHPPPPFGSPHLETISPNHTEPQTLLPLLLSTLALLPHHNACLASPFYTLHPLLRLSHLTWTHIITSIRLADLRLGYPSESSLYHTEEIKKTQSIVQRCGSLGWWGSETHEAQEAQKQLNEDFEHLIQQTEALWSDREKMKQLRHRRTEKRRTALTNGFTYLFAPISLMSGIYGMNVAQINGSPPGIWQFFVASAALGVLILVGFTVGEFVQIRMAKGRKSRKSVRQALGFAVGRVG